MLLTSINLILSLLGAAFLIRYSSRPAVSILALFVLATSTTSIVVTTDLTLFHPKLLIILSFVFLTSLITVQLFLSQKRTKTPSSLPSSASHPVSPDESICECFTQVTNPDALHSDWHSCLKKAQPVICKTLKAEELFLLDNSQSVESHNLFINPDLDNTSKHDWILSVSSLTAPLGKGQFIHNLAEKFDRDEQVILEREGIKSLLLMPLIIDKNLVAVIGLSRTNESRLFSQEEINNLLFISNILTMAISNQFVRLERDRLATVVEQSSDCTIIIDTDGSVLYANPACKEVTGFSVKEITGNSIKELYTPSIRNNMWQRMKKSIISGENWSGQFTNNRKDKTLYQEEMEISPVFDQEGRVASQVIVKRNVTEKKRLESIAEAANLMDNIGFIFSSIRHELGNPINSIKVSLSVLDSNLETYDTKDIKRFVNRSLYDIGRVEYLLKTLKNFSVFERPDISETNMVTLLDKLIKLTEKDLAKNYVMLAVNHPQEPLTGLVDPRAFLQVVLNLVANAVAALEETDNKHITFSLMKKREDQITFVIEDNGCGMDEDTVKNLFRPFFTTKPEGTGLGLVIVKKMLSKMNCSITANSEKWKGTRIEIIIPAA